MTTQASMGVLGPIGPLKDGTLVSPQAPVLRALLGMLAATTGAPLTSEALISVVWRHNPPRNPRGALHLATCRLRTWLREESPELQIVTDVSGYRLDLGESVTDLALFRHEVAASDASFESLSRALDLWRGRPFTNVPDKRLDAHLVDTLLAERDEAIRRSARAALDEQRAELAAKIVEPLCHAESLDETAHAILMEALVATGRQSAAAMVFDHIRRRLATELGIDVGARLQQAHLACLGAPPESASVRRTVSTQRPRVKLLGRQEECVKVMALAAEHRMVTVIGPPGIGKSRLAAEIALAETETGTAATHFIRLSATMDAAKVKRILGALPVIDPALLVIDGCDGWFGQIRRTVERLLMTPLPRAIIITAHQPLGMSGEVTWMMQPLGTTVSQQLFRRRAAQAMPGLAITPQDQRFVRDICLQADGIPAVIESLAALLRTFPVRALARHAAADLGSLLEDANPAAVLFSTSMDRVWTDLTATQRCLLRQVVTFPYDFSLECASQVLSGTLDGPAVLNTLVSLVDRGLVLPYDTGTGRRYRVLTPIRMMIMRRYAEQEPVSSLVHLAI